MVVCKFYLEGRCQYGDKCRFEHPAQTLGNRFAPLSTGGPFDTRRAGPPAFSHGRSNDRDQGSSAIRSFKDEFLTREGIRSDLQIDQIEWPLSSYAGHHLAPRNLFDIERSPEECRVEYYRARSESKEALARQQEQRLANEATQYRQKALQDLNGAIRYVIEGKREHPNRWDFADRWDPAEGRAKTKREEQGGSAASQSSFGQPTSGGFGATHQKGGFGQTSQSGFGQPSTVGPGKNPFMGASTTTPTAPSAPTFGQQGFGSPSAFGQRPGFGQPAQLGQPSTLGSKASPWGQATTTQFGTPSALGFGNASTSGFGQVGFGQPTAFGQKSSPWAQQSTSTANPTTSSTTASASPFGQQAASDVQGTFGAPSGPKGFGQQTESSFGQAQQRQEPVSSPFGRNPFGQDPQQQEQNGAFGRRSAGSGFGQPSLNHQPSRSVDMDLSSPRANPFGSVPSTTAVTSPPPFGQPAQNGFSSKPSGAPASFSGPNRPPFSTQQSDKETQPNSVFGSSPTAPAAPSTIASLLENGQAPEPNPEATVAPMEMYGDNLSVYEKAYAFAKDHGKFENGIMPELPPLPEWTSW